MVILTFFRFFPDDPVLRQRRRFVYPVVFHLADVRGARREPAQNRVDAGRPSERVRGKTPSQSTRLVTRPTK